VELTKFEREVMGLITRGGSDADIRVGLSAGAAKVAMALKDMMTGRVNIYDADTIETAREFYSPLTEEDIQEALEQGRRDAEACRMGRPVFGNQRYT
jgi:hypothetical protein